MNVATASNSQLSSLERPNFRFPLRTPPNAPSAPAQGPATAAATGTVPAPAQCCPYSSRQLEVLGLLAEGHSSAQVADVLQISTETVRTHRQHILHRSDRPNMLALIVQAVRHNWI